MERTTRVACVRECAQHLGIRDRRRVQNHRSTLDEPASGRRNQFLNGFVELWIAYTHNHDVRARYLLRKGTARGRYPRRALAVEADDLHPRCSKGADQSAPHMPWSDDEYSIAHGVWTRSAAPES